MYGIFDDEGLLEGDFSTREEAEHEMAVCYPEDDAHVALICPDHEDQEHGNCESCDTEEDEDSDE